ncbi:MAG: molybdopterin-dependent oxidoreductase [Lutispora sp.]|nr:molybdopterin-dependent oxidoreductase [Lutispora sp.]MDD4834090.1 molybdopterin-dependent oxidoreductase [Lutispora sp.]
MKNKKLLLAIGILAAFTLVLGYLNMKSMNTTSNEDGTITFFHGENTAKLSFDEITALEHHEFKATEDTSTSGPASRKFKGVYLKDALNRAGISDEAIGAAKKVIVKGLDGYVIAMAADEALTNKNYLAFEKDGKPLGTMKKGGSGPIQLIIAADSFSQRWCKYVTEVTIE